MVEPKAIDSNRPLFSRCPKTAITVSYSYNVILGARKASLPKIIKIEQKTKKLWSFLSPTDSRAAGFVRKDLWSKPPEFRNLSQDPP